MVTLGDLVHYVLANRRGKAFEDYEEQHIAHDIMQAVNYGGILHYAVNPDNKICGIVVALKDDESRKIFVNDILTTEDWVFKKFIEILRDNYSHYKVSGQRWCGNKPRVVKYNTKRLVNKILGEH